MIRTNLKPLDAFLQHNGLTCRHLALEAAKGNVLPLVEIGSDVFSTEEGCSRFLGRLHIRAYNGVHGINDEAE